MDYLYIFRRDQRKYEGVRRVNIYLLRLVYFLVFIFVGKESWTFIAGEIHTVTPTEAVTWCVWAAFSVLALVGVFRPLKMLPVLLLEVVYKLTWLFAVAYPMKSAGQLTGSEAEGITQAFIWVILPIIAVPWGHVFSNYIFSSRKKMQMAGEAGSINQ